MSSIVTKQLSKFQNVEVLNNIFLRGFEADIVIRKTSTVNGEEEDAVVNIELDGPSHRHNLSKKHFCELRDDNLRREHGIRIERVELCSKTAVSDIDKIINSI